MPGRTPGSPKIKKGKRVSRRHGEKNGAQGEPGTEEINNIWGRRVVNDGDTKAKQRNREHTATTHPGQRSKKRRGKVKSLSGRLKSRNQQRKR